MVEKLEKEEEKLKKTENTIAVMTMIKDGSVPETISTSGESYIVNSLFQPDCSISGTQSLLSFW